MRKSIFILAALFAATLANAQITLEHTFDGTIYSKTPMGIDHYDGINTPYLYTYDMYPNLSGQLKMYDKETYELYKTYSYTLPQVEYPHASIVLFSCNIFTTDGKAAFIMTYGSESSSGQSNCKIIDEDGNIIFDFNNQHIRGDVSLLKVGNTYKLLVREATYNNPNPHSYIYSLPGTGEVTSISEASAPRKNARKYLRNDQVLIDSNDKTYTLQGQEVK